MSNGKLFLFSMIIATLMSSCATFNAAISSDNDEGQTREISVDQRLQIQIPLPDGSKYITDKTVIFGEGSRFTGVLYLLHDSAAEEIVEYYRRSMTADGWTELAIVRSNFILVNFDKEDRFATIKVIRKMFDSSASEITIGPKSEATINRSLNIVEPSSSGEEPFEIQ